MPEKDDPYDLNRFVQAQQGDYAQALSEIRRGRKQTHWMWYIFPQLDGLGTSSMARRYAIKNLDEARAYLQHPVLGPRLRECIDHGKLLQQEFERLRALPGKARLKRIRTKVSMRPTQERPVAQVVSEEPAQGTDLTALADHLL